MRFPKLSHWLSASFCTMLAFGCEHVENTQKDPLTPLSVAITGNMAKLEEMERAGADLDVQYPSHFNWTALMAAIYFQKPAIVTNLLNHHVDVAKRDSTGNTALMWAIQLNDTNTVALLVEKMPDVLRQSEDWSQIDAAIRADDDPERWYKLLVGFLGHNHR